MKVTENQIRKIIREVLSSPKSLLKEQAARDWESYVEITTNKGYPGAQQVEDGYKKLAKKKPPTEYMKKSGWTGNETESFDDFKKWYMSWNESEFGKGLRGSNRYLSPEDVIAYFELVEQNPDPRVEAAEEVEAVVVAVKTRREEIKDRRKEHKADMKLLQQNFEQLLADIKGSDDSESLKKQKEKKLRLRLKQAKERARQDKRLDLKTIRQKFRKEGQQIRQAKREEFVKRVGNLDIDVPSAGDSGAGGSF